MLNCGVLMDSKLPESDVICLRRGFGLGVGVNDANLSMNIM